MMGLLLKWADEQDPVKKKKKNLPGDVWSKPTILTNMTPMGTIFFCNNSLLFLLTEITTNKWVEAWLGSNRHIAILPSMVSI